MEELNGELTVDLDRKLNDIQIYVTQGVGQTDSFLCIYNHFVQRAGICGKLESSGIMTGTLLLSEACGLRKLKNATNIGRQDSHY